MKLSIVIPVYNEEHYIRDCLKSIANQTEKADEIIVVDNNCTDHTLDIAKEFGVTIVKEEKQGMTYARNKGFNSATGELIARCDADSVFPPDWIQRMKKHFDDPKIIAVSGPGIFYDIHPLLSKRGLNYTMLFFSLMRFLQGFNTLFGSNMALRKSAWLKVKHEVCDDDTKVHEDMDLAIHLAKHGRVLYDKTLIMGVSSRRFKRSPYSVLVEYPIRGFKTIATHRQTS